jgi:hypothetical protein
MDHDAWRASYLTLSLAMEITKNVSSSTNVDILAFYAVSKLAYSVAAQIAYGVLSP